MTERVLVDPKDPSYRDYLHFSKKHPSYRAYLHGTKEYSVAEAEEMEKA